MKKKKMPLWRHRTVTDRLSDCRSMLFIHGMLSDAENAKVRKRIEKLVEATHKK